MLADISSVDAIYIVCGRTDMPRNKSEVRNLTWREFDWLMSGIDIEQPKAIKAT